MAFHFKTIKYSSEQGISTIQLNRPDFLNALNRLMLTELIEAFDDVASDPTIRLLVLRASGSAFCSGADINELVILGEEKEAHQFANLLSEVLDALEAIPVPVITVVHGAVYGGGLGFMAVSDVVLASRSVKMAFSEVRIGMVPAVISSYVIRKIGVSFSRYLLLTAEEFNVEKAMQCGLISHDTADDSLEESLNILLKNLLRNSAEASRTCKQMLKTVAKAPQLEATKEYTRNTFAQVLLTEDAREGLKSFHRKKKSGTSKKMGKRS